MNRGQLTVHINDVTQHTVLTTHHLQEVYFGEEEATVVGHGGSGRWGQGRGHDPQPHQEVLVACRAQSHEQSHSSCSPSESERERSHGGQHQSSLAASKLCVPSRVLARGVALDVEQCRVGTELQELGDEVDAMSHSYSQYYYTRQV